MKQLSFGIGGYFGDLNFIGMQALNLNWQTKLAYLVIIYHTFCCCDGLIPNFAHCNGREE